MAAIHNKVITFHKKLGLRSTGGPDLLKWGLPGGGIKSAKVAPTPYVYYPPESTTPYVQTNYVHYTSKLYVPRGHAPPSGPRTLCLPAAGVQ